jgi:uncharacterized protein YxjI
LETSPFLCTNSAISAFFSFRDFLRVETGPVAFAIQPDDDPPFELTVPRELHGFSQLPQEPNMRYQMRQKFFAFGDDFMIKDQDGNDIYFVDGKAFSWGDKLSFQRADTREEIAFIAQKLWSFKPKYEIHRDGNVFAEVVKEFAWFKSKFTLDVPGPNDYEITGSFWEQEYTFTRLGRTVASVSKKWFSLSDTYGIDIVSNEDDVAILATAVVVDLVCHDEKSNSNS